MKIETTHGLTIETGVPDESRPVVKLPLRYHIMVDHGLMTSDEALAKWTVEKAALGLKDFDVLED